MHIDNGPIGDDGSQWEGFEFRHEPVRVYFDFDARAHRRFLEMVREFGLTSPNELVDRALTRLDRQTRGLAPLDAESPDCLERKTPSIRERIDSLLSTLIGSSDGKLTNPGMKRETFVFNRPALDRIDAMVKYFGLKQRGEVLRKALESLDNS